MALIYRYHFLMCYIVLIIASVLDDVPNLVVGCIIQKRYTAIVLIFQPKEDVNSGNKLTEMAEDEANTDDPEDDINAYMTWFPRYVCSDVVRLVGSG